MEVGREIDSGTTLTTLLGGDDDHTIRCARTIDGSSGSILKDSHRLNILRIEHSKSVGAACATLVRLGHAVDHDKGVVGSRQRRTTTDTDVRTATGVTTRRSNNDTGACADQQVLSRSRNTGIDIIGAYDCHRTGSIRFLNRTITDHDCFSQDGRILLHNDVKVCLTIYSHIHGIISHITYHQSGIRHHVKSKVTIKIGRCAVRGAFLHNSGANQIFSQLISHVSCDSDLLSQ